MRRCRSSLRAIVTVAALALLLLTPLSARANAPIGSQFRVSFTGTNSDGAHANAPAIAYNPATDEYLVVFVSNPSNPDPQQIFGQRLSAAGAPIGDAFQISDSVNGGDLPAVAYNSHLNEYLAVWDENSGSPNQVLGQRVSATGAEVGADFQISNNGLNTFATSDVGPDIAYNSTDDQYAVVWTSTTAGQAQAFIQRLSGTGAEVAGDVQVVSDRDTTQQPTVAYNPQAHEYLVAFGGQVSNASGDQEIYGQLMNSVGARVGADTRLSTSGPPDQDLWGAAAAAAAYDSASGRSLTVWESGRSGPQQVNPQVFGRFGISSGAGEFRFTGAAERDPNRSAESAAVVANPRAGEFMALYLNSGFSDPSKEEVFAHDLGHGGATEFRVSTTGAEDNNTLIPLFPDLAYNSHANEYMAVWDANDLGDREIFGRRLSAGPVLPPPDTTSPVFASASVKPSTFAVATAGPAEVPVLSKAKKKKKHAPKGTTFHYALSEAARVVFAIERGQQGRKVKGKCVKKTKKNHKKKRCSLFKGAGRFAQQSVAGANAKKFSGRIGTKKLKPGSYRATLTATDTAGNVSKPKSLKFKVVKK